MISTIVWIVVFIIFFFYILFRVLYAHFRKSIKSLVENEERIADRQFPYDHHSLSLLKLKRFFYIWNNPRELDQEEVPIYDYQLKAYSVSMDFTFKWLLPADEISSVSEALNTETDSVGRLHLCVGEYSVELFPNDKYSFNNVIMPVDANQTKEKTPVEIEKVRLFFSWWIDEVNGKNDLLSLINETKHEVSNHFVFKWGVTKSSYDIIVDYAKKIWNIEPLNDLIIFTWDNVYNIEIHNTEPGSPEDLLNEIRKSSEEKTTSSFFNQKNTKTNNMNQLTEKMTVTLELDPAIALLLGTFIHQTAQGSLEVFKMMTDSGRESLMKIGQEIIDQVAKVAE